MSAAASSSPGKTTPRKPSRSGSVTITRRPIRCSISSAARNTSSRSTRAPAGRPCSRRSGSSWDSRRESCRCRLRLRAVRQAASRAADQVRVVVAPDSFKGSIGAAAAAAALARGWRAVRASDQVSCLPLADGGEGTLDVLAAAVPGASWHAASVSGPGSERVTSSWLELPGQTGVIELARASGLPLLASPDPLGAHTTGTGQLISAALDAGAARILIALGGSASTDGGTGALTALGARFTDTAGIRLPPGGGALASLASADLSALRPPPAGGVTCLTDVTAPLLGPLGAAAVFGPQKGAGPGQIAALEAGLTMLARVLGGDPAAPGAGAAGGTGYGFAAAWGAEIVPGAAELGRIA